MITRRTFCTSLAGVTAGLSLPWPSGLLASPPPDLVAVQGTDMTRALKATLEALGGMEQFVKPGMRVLVKPNMGWAIPPAGGANTNPKLVSLVIEACKAAGAARVMCFDNPCDHWEDAYRESGIAGIAREAGAQIGSPNREAYYHKVVVPGAKILTHASIHEMYLEADAVINMPILKHHSGTGLTAAMKNLMGAVWDRHFYHRSGLDQCICDFALAHKPTLNIVDATRVMTSGGPRGHAGSQFKRLNLLLASTDIVAIDAACAASFGTSPADHAYIGMGAQAGIGVAELDRLIIRRIRL